MARFGVFYAVSIAGLAAFLSGCASVPAKALAEEYYNLGNAWYDLKKYDLAARDYQKALSWNPDLKIAAVNLARAKAETGDTAGALALLRPEASKDPDNLVLAQYVAWLTAKLSGPAAAADLYLQLQTRLPGDAATVLNAGLCLSAAGRDTEAIDSLNAWRSLDGKGYTGLSALALLLDKSDAVSGAAAWLEAADALPVGDAKRFAPLAARARDLEASQLYGEASDAWATALALPASAGQERAEALFRRGSLLVVRIEDYVTGTDLLIQAWKAGYKDPAAWNSLLASPDLKPAVKLRADLRGAGVSP